MREGGSDWRSDSFSALQRQQGEKGEEVKAALLSFSCAGPPPATSGTCEDVLRPLKIGVFWSETELIFSHFTWIFFLVILPKIWSVGVSWWVFSSRDKKQTNQRQTDVHRRCRYSYHISVSVSMLWALTQAGTRPSSLSSPVFMSQEGSVALHFRPSLSFCR